MRLSRRSLLRSGMLAVAAPALGRLDLPLITRGPRPGAAMAARGVAVP